MSAAKLNLPVIEQGATYRHTLYWKDSSNVPINITGCTARMQLRTTVESTAVVIELSSTNNRIIITGSLGKIELYISDEDTTVLPPIQAVYDLEVYMSNGDTVRLIEGKVTIKAEVTRV